MSSRFQHTPATTTASGRFSPSLSASLPAALSTLASWKSWAINGTKAIAKSVYTTLSKVGGYLTTKIGEQWRWLTTPPTDDEMEDENDAGLVGTPRGGPTETQRSAATSTGPGQVGGHAHQGPYPGEEDAVLRSETLVSKIVSVLENVTHPIHQEPEGLANLSKLCKTVKDLSQHNLNESHHYTACPSNAEAYREQIDTDTKAVETALLNAKTRFREGFNQPNGQCMTCKITEPMIRLSKRLLSDWNPGDHAKYTRPIEQAHRDRHYRPWRPRPPAGTEYDTVIVMGTRAGGTERFRPTQMFCGRGTDAEHVNATLERWAYEHTDRPESVAPDSPAGETEVIKFTFPNGDAVLNSPRSHSYLGAPSDLPTVERALQGWGTRHNGRLPAFTGPTVGGILAHSRWLSELSRIEHLRE